jgi:hypothetical protein
MTGADSLVVDKVCRMLGISWTVKKYMETMEEKERVMYVFLNDLLPF